MSNKDKLLVAAKELRKEREREASLAEQLHLQKTTVSFRLYLDVMIKMLGQCAINQ